MSTNNTGTKRGGTDTGNENHNKNLEMYKTLYENASDGIFILDLQGHFTGCNKRIEELSGYNRKEIIGTHFRKIVPVQHVPTVLNLIEKGVKGDIDYAHLDIEIKNKKGFLVPIGITAHVLIKRGVIEGIQGIARDITEKKKMETALRKSEKKYRELFEEIKDALYISNTKGKFIDANRAMIDLLGYDTKDDLFRINIEKDFYSDPHERDNIVQTLEQENYVKDYEVNIRKKNGDVLLVQETSRIRKNLDGKTIGYEGIIRDITQQKKSEEALKKSEEQYRNLIEKSIQGLAIINKDFRIIFANKAMADILGYSVDELLDLTPFEFKNLVYRDDQEMVMGRLRDRLQGNTVIPHYEFRINRKDGSIRWLELFASPIMYPEKGSVQALAIDITARKKAEGEKRAAYKKMERALLQEKEFKLRTSHYFNNPICIAKGYLQLAIKEESHSEFYIKKAVKALNRIEKVVENIARRGEIFE